MLEDTMPARPPDTLHPNILAKKGRMSMKKWKNLSKRGLAMALAMTVSLSFSQITAFASDEGFDDTMAIGGLAGGLPEDADVVIPLPSAEELAGMEMSYPLQEQFMGFGPSLLNGDTTFDAEKYAEWRGLALDGVWAAEGNWADGTPIMEIDGEGNATFNEPKGPMGEAVVTYTFERPETTESLEPSTPILPEGSGEASSEESSDVSSEESSDVSSEESSDASSEESSEASSEESSEASSEESSEASSEESSEASSEESSEAFSEESNEAPSESAPPADTVPEGEGDVDAPAGEDGAADESHDVADDAAGVAVFSPRMLFDETQGGTPEEITEPDPKEDAAPAETAPVTDPEPAAPADTADETAPETPAEPEMVTLEWKVVVTSTVQLLDVNNITTWDELKAAITTGGSISLGADISGEGNLSINQETELNLNGHTISYGDNEPAGPMFTVKKKFTLTDSVGEGKLLGYGEALNGDNKDVKRNKYSLIVVDGGTFTMDGGAITGNYKGTPWYNQSKPTSGSDSSYDPANYSGAGVYVKSGTFTMKDGEISNNHTIYRNSGNVDLTNEWLPYYLYYGAGSASRYDRPLGQGGGVYVLGENSAFNLSGGSIIENAASEGGGVYITDKAAFTMSSGYVDSNVAYLGEGGGIYIQSNNLKSLVSGGSITNNATYTTEDLGGGGIFIEAYAYLKMENALITENTAEGLGGGIAGCLHGKIALLSIDGAAVYGNTGKKSGQVQSHSMTVQKKGQSFNINGVTFYDYIDSYVKWKDSEAFKDAAQDIFNAGWDKNGQGPSGSMISNVMIGNALANWYGYANGVEEKNIINETNNAVICASDIVGLQNRASEENKKLASDSANVIISGNTSYYTHGGGVATNGMLVLGTTGVSYFGASKEITLNKTLTGRDMEANEFTFELATEKEGGRVIAKVSNLAAEDGSVSAVKLVIPVSELTTTTERTFTFYVREKIGNKTGVSYDKTVYKVDVSVVPGVPIVKELGNNKFTIIPLVVGEPDISKVADSGESEIEDGILNFHNKMESCDLTVEKQVWYEDSSVKPEDTPEFLIQVKLGSSDEIVAEDCKVTEPVKPCPYVGEGVYNVYLKAGEKLTISGIPAGMAYEITEPDSNVEGYKLQEIVNGAGTFESDTSAVVVNHYYKAKTTNISVLKEWKAEDGSDYTGVKPAVTVQLLKDGSPEGNEITLDEGNNWRHQWEGLPEYESELGQKHQYTVVETGISYGEGYTVTKKGNVFFVEDNSTGALLGGWQSGLGEGSTAVEVILTNKWAPVDVLGNFSLNINKVDSREGKTPITGASFQLTRTGDKEFTYPVQKTVEGKITFEGLPMGSYVLKETEPAPGYQANDNVWQISIDENGKASVSSADGSDESAELKENTIIIENDIIKGSISLTKTVAGVGNIPADKEFAFNVYAISEKGAELPAEAVAALKAVHGATAAVELPYGWYAIVETGSTTIGGYRFNGVTFNGTAARYDVFVGEHGKTYEVAAVNSYSVPDPGEETEPDTTSVSVNKVWVGDTAANRPASITVNLLRNGEVYDTVTLSAGNGWHASWSNLDGDSRWSVEEADVPEGYISSVRGTSAFTITNTFTTTGEEEPEEEVPENDTPLSDLPPETAIPETEVPLAETPIEEEETIVDEKIPLADVPKTGDKENLSLWAALLAASMAGLLALVRKLRGASK